MACCFLVRIEELILPFFHPFQAEKEGKIQSPPNAAEEPEVKGKVLAPAVGDLGIGGADSLQGGAISTSTPPWGTPSRLGPRGLGTADAAVKTAEVAAATCASRAVPGGSRSTTAAVLCSGRDAAPAASPEVPFPGGTQAVAAAASCPREHTAPPRGAATASAKGPGAAAGADGGTPGATAGSVEDATLAAAVTIRFAAISGANASGASSMPLLSRPAAVSDVAEDVRPPSRASAFAEAAAGSGGAVVAAPSRAPAPDGIVAGALARVQEEFVCPITQVGMLIFGVLWEFRCVSLPI